MAEAAHAIGINAGCAIMPFRPLASMSIRHTSLMTYPTAATGRLHRIMTTQTMPVSPEGIMRSGFGVCVTACAEVGFMANLAALPAPGSLYSMSPCSPQVIVCGGGFFLMTFPAALLLMASAAKRHVLPGICAMPPSPVLPMAVRFGLLVQCRMAFGAVILGRMRRVPHPLNIAAGPCLNV